MFDVILKLYTDTKSKWDGKWRWAPDIGFSGRRGRLKIAAHA